MIVDKSHSITGSKLQDGPVQYLSQIIGRAICACHMQIIMKGNVKECNLGRAILDQSLCSCQ